MQRAVMKAPKICITLLALTLSVGGYLWVTPPLSASKVANPAIAAAVGLYCPISCTGPDYGINVPICTGFPVAVAKGGAIIMTAGHCQCNDGFNTGSNAMAVSLDGGKSWEWIGDFQAWTSTTIDAQVINVRGKPANVAVFRDAVLGEEVAGYGIPWGSFASLGIVVGVFPDWLRATNAPVGGFSGSALVGRDGKVVGMTTQGRVEERFASSFTEAIPSRILSQLLADFQKQMANPSHIQVVPQPSAVNPHRSPEQPRPEPTPPPESPAPDPEQ